MENALWACCKGIKIGKILIHREGDDGKQVWFNLPLHFMLGWVQVLNSKCVCSSSIIIYRKISQKGMFCCWTPYWEQVCWCFIHICALGAHTFPREWIMKLSLSTLLSCQIVLAVALILFLLSILRKLVFITKLLFFMLVHLSSLVLFSACECASHTYFFG